MKKSGRNSKYPKELIEKVVEEYLTTEKGAKEIGEEYKIPEHVIRYHAKKGAKRQNEEN